MAIASRSEGSYVHLDHEQPTTSNAFPSMSNHNTRPLLLHATTSHEGPTVSIPVPVAPYEIWMSAHALKEQFSRLAPPLSDQADDEDDRDAERHAQVVLCASFMGFLCGKVNAARGTQINDVPPEVKVLQQVWFTFNTSFLRLSPIGQPGSESIDVHQLTAPLDPEARANALRSYLDAFILLDAFKNRDPSLRDIQLPTPLLFRLAHADKAKVFGVFGGQGTNEVWYSLFLLGQCR